MKLPCGCIVAVDIAFIVVCTMPETTKMYMTTRNPNKHLMEVDDGEGRIMVYILQDIYCFCDKNWKRQKESITKIMRKAFFISSQVNLFRLGCALLFQCFLHDSIVLHVVCSDGLVSMKRHVGHVC